MGNEHVRTAELSLFLVAGAVSKEFSLPILVTGGAAAVVVFTARGVRRVQVRKQARRSKEG
jgi:hypothetical protein